MKIFILVFSCVISFACFWAGNKLVKLWLKVRRWKKTKAEIISKTVEERKQASASRAGYKVSLIYIYKFNNLEYRGNKTFLVELLKGERGFLKSAAEKFISKLNTQTEVYVNPENPEEAVMFCDGILLYAFTLLMAPLSLLLGILNFLN